MSVRFRGRDYDGTRRVCISRVFFAMPLHRQRKRDTESGNDYFGARYYASSMGRMMSPDWEDGPDTVPYADFTNPQSLNLYSYGYNNPLSMIDPDGHVPCNGTADITITVTPTGSSMSQSPDDCSTTTILWDWPLQNMQNQVNPPPPTPPPTPQKKTPGVCADAPLAGDPRVTTQFGAIDNSHPTKPHTGRDYAAPIGTPVYAPISGGVTYAGSAGTFGNVVAISAPLVTDSASVIYEGHLSAVSVTPGQSVHAGDQIGLSGNTGHSTGPHVHHEQHTPGPVFQNGHPPSSTLIDPCN